MFKIDKAGFYKNRKGEKAKLVQIQGQQVWLDEISANLYYLESGAYLPDRDYDIIAHWEGPLELEDFTPKEVVKSSGMAWEEFKQTNAERLNRLSKEIDFAHETDCVNKEWTLIDNKNNRKRFDSKEAAINMAHEWLMSDPTKRIKVFELVACFETSVDIKEVLVTD